MADPHEVTWIRVAVACVTLGVASGCTKGAVQNSESTRINDQGGASMISQNPSKASLLLTSSAFAQGAPIPAKYTCTGANVSPPLAWDSVPTNAKSLVLVLDDPDAPDPAAPKVDWVHWIVYNLDPSVRELAEGVSMLPGNAACGINDWKRAEYGGPCPPTGRHRYFFRLYALDVVLTLHNPTLVDMKRAMKNHVLASGELMGTYEKPR